MKNNPHPLMVSIHSLEVKIDQLNRELKIWQVKDPECVILDNADFIQMFKISTKTAQHWREDGLIEYAQVKGKIYYRLKDIKDFINRHRKTRI